jgi:hypothetical protein
LPGLCFLVYAFLLDDDLLSIVKVLPFTTGAGYTSEPPVLPAAVASAVAVVAAMAVRAAAPATP